MLVRDVVTVLEEMCVSVGVVKRFRPSSWRGRRASGCKDGRRALEYRVYDRNMCGMEKNYSRNHACSPCNHQDGKAWRARASSSPDRDDGTSALLL